jgi:lipoprotein-releasing system permease protein
MSTLRHLWLDPWTIWIGFRYLRSKKNSKFLSFITLLSIFGIGLGVCAMMIVLSVMDGFEAELKKRMMSSQAHIIIQPTAQVNGFDQGYVADDALRLPEWIEYLNSKKAKGRILELSSVLAADVILKSGKKVMGVSLKGVSQEHLNRLKENLMESVPGSVQSSSIFLGHELGFELGVIPGDEVTLISPLETEGPMGNIPRMKQYRLGGVYRAGDPEQEIHTAYTSKRTTEAFLRRADVVSQWEIILEKFEDAPQMAAEIRKILPHFRIRDWMEVNSSLFASLRLERLAMSVILAFIVVVASFNIVTTLTLMVLEKRKEISILKAMGARDGQVAAIFLAEGILIGALGVGGGLSFGFLICVLLRRYEFISLPDIYYDRTLPVTFDGRYYLGVALCAIIIVLAACLYPSKRAAQLNPLDGIRFGS